MKSVFISHTRSESDKARLLADILRKENIAVFTGADDLTPGAEWHAELLAIIRRCSLFVALVDDPGLNVMLELGYALGAAKPVLLMAGREAHIPFDIASLPVARFDAYEVSAVYDVAEKLLAKLGDGDREPRDLTGGTQALGYLLDHPDYLEEISPREFEQMIFRYFEELGFDAIQTPQTADGGYDILLKDKNTSRSTIVEVKKYARNSKLGVSSVHQLLGSMMLTDAASAILVTTGGFSASALSMAQKSPRSIKLLTLEELMSISREQLSVSASANRDA